MNNSAQKKVELCVLTFTMKILCGFSGLERIAEELMGRRRWKLYQESISRSYLQPLNNNVKDHRHDPKATSSPKNDDDGADATPEPKEKENEKSSQEVEDRLKDWTPPTKCYFCVDGKLDSEHTAHGVLVSHIASNRSEIPARLHALCARKVKVGASGCTLNRSRTVLAKLEHRWTPQGPIIIDKSRFNDAKIANQFGARFSTAKKSGQGY